MVTSTDRADEPSWLERVWMEVMAEIEAEDEMARIEAAKCAETYQDIGFKP